MISQSSGHLRLLLSSECQDSRFYGWLSVQNRYCFWKVTGEQAVRLVLGDLTCHAVAKSILVSLLEVKYLRLRTAGPEL